MTEQGKVAGDAKTQIVGVVQLKKIGNSTGVILPKELMARLNLSVGDTFYATLTPDGSLARWIRDRWPQ
jgi:antitoxin component of MazEF toxin-antitoxin module